MDANRDVTGRRAERGARHHDHDHPGRSRRDAGGTSAWFRLTAAGSADRRSCAGRLRRRVRTTSTTRSITSTTAVMISERPGRQSCQAKAAGEAEHRRQDADDGGINVFHERASSGCGHGVEPRRSCRSDQPAGGAQQPGIVALLRDQLHADRHAVGAGEQRQRHRRQARAASRWCRTPGCRCSPARAAAGPVVAGVTIMS